MSPKRVLEVKDEMQRKRGKKTKKEEEEQIHWMGQGVRQYLFSKSLRTECSGGEGAGDAEGGDDKPKMLSSTPRNDDKIKLLASE